MAITISASTVKDRFTVEAGSVFVGPPRGIATTAARTPTVTGAGGSTIMTETLYSTQTPTNSPNGNPNGTDGVPLSLGSKFIPYADGNITGIRVYRATTAPTTLTVTLYSATGTQLAQTNIPSPTPGWNTGTFTTPVAVTIGTTYMAAYFTNTPYVSADVFPLSNTYLASFGNYYDYSSTPINPTILDGNALGGYFVDPIFVFDSALITPPVGVMGWLLTPSQIGLVGKGLIKENFPVYAGTDTPLANTTISQMRINSSLNLVNGNITIDSCWIAPPSAGGGMTMLFTRDLNTQIDAPVQATIKDCEFDGSFLPTGTYPAVNQRAFTYPFMGNATLLRNYVHDMGSGIAIYHSGDIDVNPILIENNYVENLMSWGPPATDGNHVETFTIRDWNTANLPGRILTLRGNHFDSRTANDSGACFIQTQGGSIYHVIVENNLFMSTGWCMTLNESQIAFPGQFYGGMRKHHNRFVKGVYGYSTVQGGIGWDENIDNWSYAAGNSVGDYRGGDFVD